MSNFFEGLALHQAEPVIDFTPEHRLYYNKETGEITQRVVTEYQVVPPTGDYIILPKEDFYLVRGDGKVIDGRVVYPAKPKRFNLVKSTEGYGTIKNNPYIVGNEDFWEYKKDYE